MPLYPTKCVDGHTGESFSRDPKRLRCPVCDARAEIDWPHMTVRNGNREFFGKTRVSMIHGCAANEVGEYRAMIGGSAANCIQADGSVKFNNRAEERDFARRQQRLQQRASDRKLARESKDASSGA